MMFRFMLTDDEEPLRCRRHCQKAFMEGHPNTIVVNDDFLYFIIDTILRKNMNTASIPIPEAILCLVRRALWAQIGGKCYYFYASGKPAVSATIDGYKVGEDGARNA